MTHPFPTPPRRLGPAPSVWAAGQHDAPEQLVHGPYVPETGQDVDRVPPAVAAHAIAAHTRPGDTVLDPDCGAGTVVVEALRAGRHAIGITNHPRWRPTVRANLAAALHGRAGLYGIAKWPLAVMRSRC